MLYLCSETQKVKNMSKLKLLVYMVALVGFLLSLWLMPTSFAWAAFTAIHTFWFQVALCVMAVLWLALLQPWKIFTDSHFSDLVCVMRYALIALIS